MARDFVQFEPQRGAQPSQPTTAWVQYDEVALYVAFRVAEPDEPIAELTRRDADLFEDDVVVVVLDSFLDRQSGYYFMTNLLGTQTDGRIVNDGRTTDPTWGRRLAGCGAALLYELVGGARDSFRFDQVRLGRGC